MKIAVAQIRPVVGAFESNVRQIEEAYERACAEQARLLLTPEMALCGYPPHDLVDRPEMVERNEKALAGLADATRGKNCALAVGHVAATASQWGKASQNAISVLEGGSVVFRQAKTLLPTYDVFDEARFFEPAQEIRLWECDGTKIAFAVCEDLWARDPALQRRLYARDPIDTYVELGANLIVSLSASPYEWGKRERREELHADASRRVGAPLLYVNQVGATDEVLFDGGSFAMASSGELVGRLPIFSESFGLVEFRDSELRWVSPELSEREDHSPSEIEILSRALVIGIREYFGRTGFKNAIIGLSGGVDSAIVATLAVRALGANHVLGVAMPSQYSSGESLEDAEKLARNLAIPFEVRPIKFLYSTAAREISDRLGKLNPVADENLQARLRGLILMTLANHYSALTLTTGNKSELAMGYCTMYGDMAGAIAPIGDLFKTRVYELARYLNQTWGNPIPERVLTKAPSAELRPNQTDQDTLPPYEILDELLREYLEQFAPIEDLETKYRDREPSRGPRWVRDTLRCVERNEYKRRQAAPVLKVSPKAFGIGRRIPIAKTWDQFD